SNDEDSVRGLHQGQQSLRTAPTGRTHDCKRLLCGTLHFLLPGGGHPHMKRREFITLLGGAAAWPLTVSAQQAKHPVRIGFLPPGSPPNAYDRSLVEAFRQGLRQADLVENRDIVLDVVWISGDPDQAVNELMQRGAQMLIPCGSSASVAAQRRAPT